MQNPTLTITGMDGRHVSSQVLSHAKETVDLDVSSGIYLIHLKAGDQEYVERIIVE